MTTYVNTTQYVTVEQRRITILYIWLRFLRRNHIDGFRGKELEINYWE